VVSEHERAAKKYAGEERVALGGEMARASGRRQGCHLLHGATTSSGDAMKIKSDEERHLKAKVTKLPFY
jgi:hypothetical protein